MLWLPAQVTQPIGEQLDEPVAGGVAERIVDRFETVEVDVQDGDRAGLPAASRSDRWASSARRLRKPVRSSCSARWRSWSSAAMRARNCANSEAIVSRVLIASGFHFCRGT